MLKLIDFQPWHLGLITSTYSRKQTAQEFIKELPEDAVLKTIYWGTTLIGIGSYTWNEILKSYEVGIFVDERSRVAPRKLLLAARGGIKWLRENYGDNWVCTIDASVRGRARFVEALGLEYKETVENYFDLLEPAEIWILANDRD